MIKNKLINIMLLFAVFSGNVWADSKAIYDSKINTLSLEGVLVPFTDEFTGKLTDNKGIFDAELDEINKLLFKLNPQSINFQVNTIATFGNGVEGNYEVSGGGIEGTIRAVSKGSWITKDFKVSLVSEMAYIFLAKNLKYDFDANKVDNRLNEVAKTILSRDIGGDGNVNVGDLLVFDYQSNLNGINSSEFSEIIRMLLVV